MKVLFDLNHPAHVHFFKYTIKTLIDEGHSVVITSRVKECATDLLEEFNLEHHVLSAERKGGVLSLFKELLVRDFKLAQFVLSEKPDVMLSIGGIFIAHVGCLTRVPSLVFYDTENAKLQNLITYPFASKVIVPDCYKAGVPEKKMLRYKGYHELAYLHPDYFLSSKLVALSGGLSEHEDTFLVRIVAWNANHDVGEAGWSEALLVNVVSHLESLGKVIISSEGELPNGLERLRYSGAVKDIHHLMAYCRLFVGESATMASECAVLGVPAIYAAETGRGYTDEQQKLYQLVENVSVLNKENIISAIDTILSENRDFYRAKNRSLLENTIDVNDFIGEQIIAACSQRNR